MLYSMREYSSAVHVECDLSADRSDDRSSYPVDAAKFRRRRPTVVHKTKIIDFRPCRGTSVYDHTPPIEKWKEVSRVTHSRII